MKLTRAEVAATILDVTVARFYDLARTGVLPVGVVVHVGRQIRIDEDALREWIRGGGQALAGGWRREAETALVLGHTNTAPPRPRRGR